MYRVEFEQIKNRLENNMPKYAKRIIGNYTKLYPRSQTIWIDALNKEDVPSNIAENSVYISFHIDLNENTFETFRCGCVWLTPEEQKQTYMSMASLKDIAKARGVKWLRKSKYKSVDDVCNKISKFYDEVLKAVDDYTQGYPFKQGVGFVKP